MLPRIVNELNQPQIDQINRVAQSGGRLVLKPTRKQIEGGFLGTLASIGIPMAISLVSKMFGGGLQVDKTPPPPPPPSPNPLSKMFIFLKQEDSFQCILLPFTEIGMKLLVWEKKLEREKKLEKVKKKKAKDCC